MRRHAVISMNLCLVLAFAGPISSATAQDGVVVAGGISFEGELEVRQPNSGYVAISAGAGHSLAMKADGSGEDVSLGLKVVGVSLAKDAGAGVVLVSWTGGTGPYTLRRSRNPQFTQDVVTLVDEQNDTSYDDSVLNDGVNYYYDVQ